MASSSSSFEVVEVDSLLWHIEVGCTEKYKVIKGGIRGGDFYDHLQYQTIEFDTLLSVTETADTLTLYYSRYNELITDSSYIRPYWEQIFNFRNWFLRQFDSQVMRLTNGEPSPGGYTWDYDGILTAAVPEVGFVRNREGFCGGFYSCYPQNQSLISKHCPSIGRVYYNQEHDVFKSDFGYLENGIHSKYYQVEDSLVSDTAVIDLNWKEGCVRTWMSFDKDNIESIVYDTLKSIIAKGDTLEFDFSFGRTQVLGSEIKSFKGGDTLTEKSVLYNKKYDLILRNEMFNQGDTVQEKLVSIWEKQRISYKWKDAIGWVNFRKDSTAFGGGSGIYSFDHELASLVCQSDTLYSNPEVIVPVSSKDAENRLHNIKAFDLKGRLLWSRNMNLTEFRELRSKMLKASVLGLYRFKVD